MIERLSGSRGQATQSIGGPRPLVVAGYSSIVKHVVSYCAVLFVGFYAGITWDEQALSVPPQPQDLQASPLSHTLRTMPAADVAAVPCRNDAPATSPDTSLAPAITFLELAKETGTDKVEGHANFKSCLEKDSLCICKECERAACAPWGHFYDTMYERWLRPYAGDEAEPFQFLEIGYYSGKGFDAYTRFMPRAEAHSMELFCESAHAQENPRFGELRQAERLHCGDASSYRFLHDTWTAKMRRPAKFWRPDAPPLKVVVDDASHMAQHMAASLFFWIPRLAPGGVFIVEDIQPLDHAHANKFRTAILPQVLKDLHWCGDPALPDARCFPALQPYLAGVHCEMHICAFLRNDVAASEPDEAASRTPADAFSGAAQCMYGPHK